jgi:hypothetical protein
MLTLSLVFKLEVDPARKQCAEHIDLSLGLVFGRKYPRLIPGNEPFRANERVVADPLWRGWMSGDFNDETHVRAATAKNAPYAN